MNNIPAHLARYWRPEPTDAASPPPAPRLRPCLWADCTDQRTGALFCSRHSATARRASIAGTLPPMAEIADMRPSQIATLTRAPKPPAPVVILPPRPASPSRLCLWPDCGRSAGRRSLCSRCKARRRRLILHAAIPDAPLTPKIAATLPALWVQHCQRVHIRQRLQGWPAAPPLEIAATPAPGACIIAGCERTNHRGRGLCCRCYNRAKYRGELERFPAKNKPRYDARLNPQEV